jgi:hypothetical protein
LKHTSNAGRIDSERFFCEYVNPFFDSVFKFPRTKDWRGCQKNDPASTDGINCLFITIESAELTVWGDINIASEPLNIATT